VIQYFNHELSPTLNRFLCDALIQAQLLAMHKELLEKKYAKKTKPTNNARSRRTIRMTGLLYVRDVKNHLDAKKIDGIRKT
jgi:hypothetical protein